MKDQESKFNWEHILSLIIVMGTIIGTTVPLYIHLSSTSDRQIESIRLDVNAIHQEMKDFHGRLEKIDAEFKCHLSAKNTIVNAKTNAVE